MTTFEYLNLILIKYPVDYLVIGDRFAIIIASNFYYTNNGNLRIISDGKYGDLNKPQQEEIIQTMEKLFNIEIKSVDLNINFIWN